MSNKAVRYISAKGEEGGAGVNGGKSCGESKYKKVQLREFRGDELKKTVRYFNGEIASSAALNQCIRK